MLCSLKCKSRGTTQANSCKSNNKIYYLLSGNTSLLKILSHARGAGSPFLYFCMFYALQVEFASYRLSNNLVCSLKCKSHGTTQANSCKSNMIYYLLSGNTSLLKIYYGNFYISVCFMHYKLSLQIIDCPIIW